MLSSSSLLPQERTTNVCIAAFPSLFLSRLQNASSISHASSGGPTEALAKKYFSTLTRAQVRGLYRHYRDDFEAFGYSPKVYLELAKKG